MIFGFNTDIKVGNIVFHVQTEDRGENNPTIDTTIYFKGRVLAQRAVSYKEYFESPEFDTEVLKARVESHHKKWVAAVKNSELEEMAEFQQAETPKNDAIKVELLNPSSIFHASLIQVEAAVKRLSNGGALVDAEIRVRFVPDGDSPIEGKGRCDTNGKAVVKLPLPRIGPNGAELFIHAQAGQARAELRYSLRPRGAQKK